MLPGLLAFVLPFVPHEHPLPWAELVRLTVLAILLTLGVIAIFSSIARRGEEYWLFNVVSYPASIVLTLLAFPAHPEFAAVVLVVLAFGDGSATLFGLLGGHSSLPWNPRKTWLGSAAFIICASPLAALAYWEESQPHVAFAAAIGVGLISTFISAIVESLPLRICDNFRVGVAAVVAVVAAHCTILGWP